MVDCGWGGGCGFAGRGGVGEVGLGWKGGGLRGWRVERNWEGWFVCFGLKGWEEWMIVRIEVLGGEDDSLN